MPPEMVGFMVTPLSKKLKVPVKAGYTLLWVDCWFLVVGCGWKSKG